MINAIFFLFTIISLLSFAKAVEDNNDDFIFLSFWMLMFAFIGFLSQYDF